MPQGRGQGFTLNVADLARGLLGKRSEPRPAELCGPAGCVQVPHGQPTPRGWIWNVRGYGAPVKEEEPKPFDVTQYWSGFAGYGSQTREQRASRKYEGRPKGNRPWWEICPTMDLDCVRENYQEIQRSWIIETGLQLLPEMFSGMGARGVRPPKGTVFKPYSVPTAGGVKPPPRAPRVPRSIGNTALALAPATAPARVPLSIVRPGVNPQAVARQNVIPTAMPTSFIAPSLMLETTLAPVQVTAQRVGTRAAQVAIPEPLDEVQVTARYVSGVSDEELWWDQYVGTGDNPALEANPRPRPATAPQRATRSASTAGKTAPATGTARRPARVAVPGLAAIKLSPQSLIRGLLKYTTRRAAAPGQVSQLARSTLARPGSPLEPILGQSFAVSPNPYTQPQPVQATDKCNCDKRKKKREPRKPRTECWTGSYRETARGTSKKRREQIPCN